MKHKTNCKSEKNILKLKSHVAMLALIIGLISISTQTARAGSLFEMINDLLDKFN